MAVNLPVLFEDETKTVTAHFTLHTPMLAAPPVRVTLSTTPIQPSAYGAGGWDGSGGMFLRGETEDHPSPGRLDYDYRWSESGVRETFSQPPGWFWPTNPPPASPPGYQDPKGPPPAAPPPKQPRKPGDGLTPYTPEGDQPPRLGDDPVGNPIVTNKTIKGMPDIKQGTNQCVPTATANSLSYLYSKANMQPPASDKFNKKLKEELAKAMGTTAKHGTQIDTAEPSKNKFLQGKARADIDERLRNGKVTITRQNPSIDTVKDAVDKGYNIEIVLTSYNADGSTNAQHMVTVVGYAVRKDGTVELKIHDPNDREKGEKPGDTAHPPRENTLEVKPYENGKGGLRVTGGIRSKGKTVIITHLFVEKLAPRMVTYPFGIKASDRSPAVGGSVILWDSFNTEPLPDVHYQWVRDGTDVPGATSTELVIEPFEADDYGNYSLWLFDTNEQAYAISPEIRLDPGSIYMLR